jgi:hypothetical protein
MTIAVTTGHYRAAEARLRRHRWKRARPAADGLGAWTHRARGLALIHSIALERDGELWEHVSVSRSDDTMPTWEQLRDAFHDICGPEALGIVVIPPASEHVNLAEVAHAWRCLTARPIPDFTRGLGTI